MIYDGAGGFLFLEGNFCKTLKKRIEEKLPNAKARRDDPKLVIKAFIILLLYFLTLMLYI